MAAIDIGTNSVLYSLFEIDRRKRLEEVFFKRESPRLGGNLSGRTKPCISEESYEAVRRILRRNIKHARKNNAREIIIAATNPLRLAVNGKNIAARLSKDLGVKVEILSSDREARLSFMGAVGKLRTDQTMALIDLGGGSTEIAVYRGAKRLAFVSLPEGAVSLTEKFKSTGSISPDDLPGFERILASYKKSVKPILPYCKSRFILVGGTTSALAYLKDNDFHRLDKKTDLTVSEIQIFISLLSRLNLKGRRQLLEIDKKRAEIILAGAFWLSYLFKILGLKQAVATGRGLRHGLICERLGG